MKKLFCLFLIICLVPVFAAAETLSSMSYDELVELSQQITKEIMSRPEWKQVEVPAGVWNIGTDIPEGSYSVKPVNRSLNFFVYNEKGILVGNFIIDEQLGRVELESGWKLKITYPVYFAPPMALGF